MTKLNIKARTITGPFLTSLEPKPIITEETKSKFAESLGNNFSRELKLRMLIQNPITFHHSQDMSGRR